MHGVEIVKLPVLPIESDSYTNHPVTPFNGAVYVDEHGNPMQTDNLAPETPLTPTGREFDVNGHPVKP